MSIPASAAGTVATVHEEGRSACGVWTIAEATQQVCCGNVVTLSSLTRSGMEKRAEGAFRLRRMVRFE